MNRLLTTLCCTALMTFGWVIGTHDDTVVRANDPPTLNFTMPVDFQASFLKKIVESLTQEMKENVRVDTVRVTEVKRVKVRVPYRVAERDTSYVPVMLIITPGDRKEFTPDSIPMNTGTVQESENDRNSHDDIDTSI